MLEAPLPFNTSARAAIILCAAFILGGCACNDAKWNAAPVQESLSSTIEGRWEGTWTSTGDGNTGGLECIVTRTGDDTYTANYHATYWNNLHFAYSLPLHADQREGVTYFEGDANLGWLASLIEGGDYHYEGYADGVTFHCEYRTGFDFGRFDMHRVIVTTQPTTQP
jgi:hypothetical protein